MFSIVFLLVADSMSPTASFVSGVAVPHQTLQHPLCPGVPLPGQMTLAQLLTLAQEQGMSLSTPCIALTLTQHSKTSSSKDTKGMLMYTVHRLHCPIDECSYNTVGAVEKHVKPFLRGWFRSPPCLQKMLGHCVIRLLVYTGSSKKI